MKLKSLLFVLGFIPFMVFAQAPVDLKAPEPENVHLSPPSITESWSGKQYDNPNQYEGSGNIPVAYPVDSPVYFRLSRLGPPTPPR